MPAPRRRPAEERPGSPRDPRPAVRRRVSHSLESVVTEAVALLDQSGEGALTFRALAARMGGGVGSIYWYVSSKDELLDRASDHVLAGVLRDTVRFIGGPDPVEGVRGIAVALFDAVAERPWLGGYFMRNTDTQPHALMLFERVGQQVMRLSMSPRQSFHAVSAVIGFVIGAAADLGQEPPPEVVDGSVDREHYIAHFADRWRDLDPGTYPFLHHVVDEFAHHDDRDQFLDGLDLLLAGLRLRAGEGPGEIVTP